MTASNGIFALIVAVAAGFFAYNVQRLVGYLRMGRLDDSRWDHVPRRLVNLLSIGYDLTDNMPLIAGVAWILAALRLRGG